MDPATVYNGACGRVRRSLPPPRVPRWTADHAQLFERLEMVWELYDLELDGQIDGVPAGQKQYPPRRYPGDAAASRPRSLAAPTPAAWGV